MPFSFQRSRSNRAFERLYRQYVGDVYGYAYALLANRADAEDAAQVAFLNAYRAFRQGERPEQPLNWLIAITHNVCRQRARDAARRPREVVLDRELVAEPAGDEDGRFRGEDVRRAFSQLAFNQRAALAMRELEGRSYNEIAEVLGISNSAVETLIFRARRAFREQLEGSLTCGETERAISLQLDGMIASGEEAGLRAHLRACSECASVARRFRAQRAALKGIAIVPLPASLSSFGFSAGAPVLAGGAALGGVGIKVAAFGAAALIATGVGSHVVGGSTPGSARPVTNGDRAPARSASSTARIAPDLGRGREPLKLPGLGHKVVASGRDQPLGSPGRQLHPHAKAVLPDKATERGPALAAGSAVHRSTRSATGNREAPAHGSPATRARGAAATRARRVRGTAGGLTAARHAGKLDSHAKIGGAQPPEHGAKPIQPAPPEQPSAQSGAGPSSTSGASPATPAPSTSPAPAAAETPAHEPPAAAHEPSPRPKPEK